MNPELSGHLPSSRQPLPHYKTPNLSSNFHALGQATSIFAQHNTLYRITTTITMADPDPSKWRVKRDPNINARTSTPKPNPLSTNPGVQNFDISDEDHFTSDGVGNETTWPPQNKKARVRDTEFLRLLTEAYNKRGDLVREWSKFALSPSYIKRRNISLT